MLELHTFQYTVTARNCFLLLWPENVFLFHQCLLQILSVVSLIKMEALAPFMKSCSLTIECNVNETTVVEYK